MVGEEERKERAKGLEKEAKKLEREKIERAERTGQER